MVHERMVILNTVFLKEVDGSWGGGIRRRCPAERSLTVEGSKGFDGFVEDLTFLSFGEGGNLLMGVPVEADFVTRFSNFCYLNRKRFHRVCWNKPRSLDVMLI